MEKRFQVFVSSTFRDLQEERQQVIQALLELDCMPAGMELFPASDETKWGLITRVINDCDYYIVIVGGRYGSVDEEGISFTEREYDYAVAKNIPVLAFLHAEPDAIPAGKTELQPDARRKLDTFRQKVEQKMCRKWKTPEELGGVVSRSLVQEMKGNPGEGWIRGRYASNPEELQRLHSKIDELTTRLQTAKTEPPPEAKYLAKGQEIHVIRFIITHLLTRTSTKQMQIELSWDDIFTILGPMMFNEASESDLKKQLCNKALQKPLTEYERISVLNEDFDTIKIQLHSLGLIQKSDKKHSLKARDTYWMLTPYGEHYATLLKAIPTQNRKSEDARPNS